MNAGIGEEAGDERGLTVGAKETAVVLKAGEICGRACSTALRAPMPLATTPRLADLQSSSDRGLPTSRPREWRMSRSALLWLAACSCGRRVLF